jgi:uncharacterized membrane protein
MSKQKNRAHRDDEPPRRDWLVAALSAAGFVVAVYLSFTKLAGASALFCETGGGCDVVQASRYALFLGLPTAAWGAALYATVGALALARLTVRRWLVAFCLSVAAVSFSAYLTYLSVFELGATCGYCLASAGIALALFGLLLARRPVAGKRLRGARLVTLGLMTAVVTVIVGAAVFAWESPREAEARAEGLARHLAGSGAVMYGAFW